MKLLELTITVLGSIVFLVLLSLLFSLPVFYLWNGCLVGAINGVNEVTWVQAWGLNILASFLFKTTVTNKS